MIQSSSHSLTKVLKDKNMAAPKTHIILGSGLAATFGKIEIPTPFEDAGEIAFDEVPGLLSSSVEGHKGSYRFYKNAETGNILSFQIGRIHGYEGHDPASVVQPVVQMALAGTENFIITNAAGSLRPEFKAGSFMIIEDQVNFTGKNPLSGPNSTNSEGKEYGPRFPDMSEAYSKELNSLLEETLSAVGVKAHRGIYFGVNGPSFETPAEVKLFSQWGMGSVGMSTVWESIALRYLNRKVGGLSFISNMGCGLVPDQELTHEEVQEEADRSSPKVLKALFDLALRVEKLA